MKSTKVSAFLLIALTLLFSACKKISGNDPEYFLKFKLNGNWVTHTAAVGELGPDLADDSYTDLGITGNSDNGNEVFDIGIQVAGSNFSTGTYNTDDHTVFISYVINSPALKFYTLGSVDGQPDSRYTVTITSITDDTIKGTFTGNYLEDGSVGDATVEVTEGEFVVPRIR